MSWGEMPSRDAVVRSIAIATWSPSSCCSLPTSASSGFARSAARSFGAQRASSAPSASSSVYWNWVRLTRAATVRSCRRMTSVADSRRSASGFRFTRMRPLFSVTFVPSIPMNDDKLSTAGSSRMTRASARWRSAMAGNEIDCGASEMPRTAPVSSTGKNPFGTTT